MAACWVPGPGPVVVWGWLVGGPCGCGRGRLLSWSLLLGAGGGGCCWLLGPRAVVRGAGVVAGHAVGFWGLCVLVAWSWLVRACACGGWGVGGVVVNCIAGASVGLPCCASWLFPWRCLLGVRGPWVGRWGAGVVACRGVDFRRPRARVLAGLGGSWVVGRVGAGGVVCSLCAVLWCACLCGRSVDALAPGADEGRGGLR